jgi:hypothetical protein
VLPLQGLQVADIVLATTLMASATSRRSATPTALTEEGDKLSPHDWLPVPDRE